jgi:hypothetical protein
MISKIFAAIAWLNGKKTYITAAAGIITAAVAWWNGSLDAHTALETIWAALMVMGVRHGVDKKA